MNYTIKDVAKLADVSVTSVSQVLNERNIRISEEKKQKIYDAVKELNYSPNIHASNLKNKRNKTIGLIIPDLMNLYFIEIAKGIVNKAQDLGFSVVISDSNNNAINDIYGLEKFRNNGMDGIIIAPSSEEDAKLKQTMGKFIERNKMPIVLLDRSTGENNCHSIMTNNFHGGYIATKHLIQLGHKKIGCITGPKEQKSANARINGYRKACEEMNIELNPLWVANGDYKLLSGYECCNQLVCQGITAIFACNDMMAYGVYKYLREHKIIIPDQMSVIGFDDVFFSDIVDVPLTTVSQPILRMGEKAVQILAQSFDTTDVEINNIVFETKLVIRNSTAPIQA